MAKYLIGAGLLLVIFGVVLLYAPGLFSWFGKLPGDITIQTAHSRVFIPITSMLIISIIVSILLNILR